MGPVLVLLLLTAIRLTAGQGSDHPTANLSTTWINNASFFPNVVFTEGVRPGILPIVLRSPETSKGPSFCAGFVCRSSSSTGQVDDTACQFGVFMLFINSSDTVIWSSPQVIWSANPDRPIQENATLEFTSDGNLILHDADGSLVWSSGTGNRSVAGMELAELGNLVLFDRMKAPVWQSFDHPTNVLVPGQSLLEGMRLTASATNWTQFEIYYYMTVLSYGLYAYSESTPPQLYFSRWAAEKKVTFTNGSLGSITLPAAKYTQFLRFESDGHLRLYEWSDNIGEEWPMVSDVMKMFLDDCSFPTACGEYGVCTGRQCICPSPGDSRTQYFKPVDGKKANQGCLPQTPISCQEMQHHELLTLPDVSYFDTSSNVIGDARSRDDCKQACLKNCSCKAVIFRYGSNDSYGK